MPAQMRVEVRVPASSANLGPGFDCLGLALDLWNTFVFEALPDGAPSPQIAFASVWGEDAALAALPVDASNLAYRVFADHLAEVGHAIPAVKVTIALGIPASRGLGSSATAVVGGLLAAAAWAKMPDGLAQRQGLLAAAARYERGQHADNVAAALLGGLVAVARAGDDWRAVRVPLPENLRAVLFVPSFAMDTVACRDLLPAHYARADAVHNVGHTGLLVAALATGDLDALSAAMDDRLHESYRAKIFPQMPDLIAAARVAGAHGACLSGGGSAILALATEHAQDVARAMQLTAVASGIEGRALIVRVVPGGAEVHTAAPEPLTFLCQCGTRDADLRRTDYRCACGQPVDVDLGTLGADRAGAEWRRIFDDRLRSRAVVDQSGVWRFRDLLLSLPEVAPIARPEGQTNRYPVGRALGDSGHARIGAFAGVDQLWLKHEGENPTGSFKDRGMTVGVSIARWLGASAVACASTGNTSASMAAYAAQAGLRAIVLLPAGKVAAGKLSQAIAYGAEIRQIAGDFDRAMADVERLCLDEGIYLLNSLNPFRILGQQSLAFELAQQFGWDLPDWIALPAGNLGNTSALGMGLLRAHQLGIIPRLPRIAAIQAAGANPFYQSYLRDFADLQPVTAHTIATAINIGNPVSFPRARAVIRATNGVVAQVTDDEILLAKAVIDRAGIGCEPASAASVAGVRQLVTAGVILPNDRVACILTGNVLKDPDAIMRMALPFMLNGEVDGTRNDTELAQKNAEYDTTSRAIPRSSLPSPAERYEEVR
jgi:threonine synthase